MNRPFELLARESRSRCQVRESATEEGKRDPRYRAVKAVVRARGDAIEPWEGMGMVPRTKPTVSLDWDDMAEETYRLVRYVGLETELPPPT